jgi:hypothetical protein
LREKAALPVRGRGRARAKSLDYGAAHLLRYRRRERIAYLPVSGRLLSCKVPGVRKSLEAGDHPDSEPGLGAYRKAGSGRVIGDAEPIHSEGYPLAPGARRA